MPDIYTSRKFRMCSSSLRGAQRRGNLNLPRLLHFVRNDKTVVTRLKLMALGLARSQIEVLRTACDATSIHLSTQFINQDFQHARTEF
jgi:hypothetical protein